MTFKSSRRGVLSERKRRELHYGAGGCGLLRSLAIYWPGNEPAGALWDVHVNGINLGEVNTVTSNPGHVYALSRQYTAANVEYHTTSSVEVLQVGGQDFTVALWVYVDSFSATGNWLINKRDEFTEQEYQLDARSTATNFSAWVGGWQTASTAALSTGAWHLLIGWVDSGTATVYLSVDNGTPVSAAMGGAITSGSAAVGVGAGIWNPAAAISHNGRIGPTAFWKSAAGGGGALTAAQRTCLWNDGAGLKYTEFT